MRRFRFRLAVWACAALLTALACPVLAQERATGLSLSAGAFNFSTSPSDLEVGMELRTPTRLWKLDLAGGFAVTDEGGGWLYGGVRRDFPFGGRFVAAPGLGVALYEQGDGKDLGGSFQFRSALEVTYRVTRKARIGLTLAHLSNAGLNDFNPGANSALLTYGVDLR